MLDELTFEIHARVNGDQFNYEITLPDSIKDLKESQAEAIIRVLVPDASSVEILHVACLY